jgi:hypothetical protein
MVMTGVLYAGKWPGGDPAAWTDGLARPWPSRAQMQAERRGLEPSAAGAMTSDAAPAATPVRSSSRKRRKRGGRG